MQFCIVLNSHQLWVCISLCSVWGVWKMSAENLSQERLARGVSQGRVSQGIYYNGLIRSRAFRTWHAPCAHRRLRTARWDDR